MQAIVAFAIFSPQRENEITRITWADPEDTNARIIIRDMKNRCEKVGNNLWCYPTPEMLAIIREQPKTDDQIFPRSTDAVCAAFTRACDTVGVNARHGAAAFPRHAPRWRIASFRDGLEHPLRRRNVRPKLAIPDR
jgi:integrase